jgi:hypothetical protein
VPFAPAVAIELSTPVPKSAPAITATVTQASGESTISRLAVEFPKAFGYNERFTLPRCGKAAEAAEACPDGSRIGAVSATSPLGAASGSVYITEDFRLVAFASAFGGLVKIKVIGTVSIASTGGFAVGFTGLPDLPLNSVKLALDGGGKGLLKNPARCGTYSLPTKFEAHDGSRAQADPTIAITGCKPPRVSDVLVAPQGRRVQVLWEATDTTEATQVRLERRRASRWTAVARRKVTSTETAFSGVAPGRYRVKLTALPGGKTTTRAFSF